MVFVQCKRTQTHTIEWKEMTHHQLHASCSLVLNHRLRTIPFYIYLFAVACVFVLPFSFSFTHIPLQRHVNHIKSFWITFVDIFIFSDNIIIPVHTMHTFTYLNFFYWLFSLSLALSFFSSQMFWSVIHFSVDLLENYIFASILWLQKFAIAWHGVASLFYYYKYKSRCTHEL